MSRLFVINSEKLAETRYDAMGASHRLRDRTHPVNPQPSWPPSELLTTPVVAIAFRRLDMTRKVFDVMPPVQPSPQKRDRTGY
ncbi:hypothetical protein SPLC1_S131460 [Arthrospira platensis C1]|nr:hypothetical protein SPLC1_S131460 [Arthrospira platensis C1]